MSSIEKHTTRIAAIAFVVVAAVVLWFFSPLETGLYPRCVVLTLTGWECPGCGSQRALHELAHLRIGAAWGYNPLLVVAIPYLALGFIVETAYRRKPSGWSAKLRTRLYGQRAIVVVLVVIVAFAIVRNVL
ncbi:MAG: DUF2752 domain-containing protein [Rikenellaceae bacterium]